MEINAKIFIAGGTGLVGSAVIRKLVENGFTNIIASYHKRKPLTAHRSPLTWSLLNLTRQLDVEAFFEKEKPEYVFLAAAKVGGILANNTYKADFIYDNIAIASNVIHASWRYGVKKLLNLGSSCIYPKLAPQPMKEDYLLTGELEPTNEPYAVAKIAAIKLCRYFNEQYGTNFISVMPTNLYGPGDNFDLENSHVLPALIRKMHLAKLLSEGDFDLIKKDFLTFGNTKVVTGSKEYNITETTDRATIISVLDHFGIKLSSPAKTRSPLTAHSSPVEITLWGTGKPYREFLHVDDLAEAVTFLVNNYNFPEIGEFINIGSGQDLTIAELSTLVNRVVSFQGGITFDPSKPDGTPKKLLDVSRIGKLGWKAQYGLENGIRETYRWYSKLLTGQ